MPKPSKSSGSHAPELTGRTVWDIAWGFSSQRRSVVAALFVFTLSVVFAVRFGWLEMSWDNGFRISLTRPISHEVAQRLVGSWSGAGSDNSSSGSNPYFSYRLRFRFSSKGRTIYLDGDYDIVDQSLPQRVLTGSGEIRDDYARLTYEYHGRDRPGTVGYGIMLVHIPPSGSVIHCWYASRAMQDDTVKTGTLELTRSN